MHLSNIRNELYRVFRRSEKDDGDPACLNVVFTPLLITDNQTTDGLSNVPEASKLKLVVPIINKGFTLKKYYSYGLCSYDNKREDKARNIISLKIQPSRLTDPKYTRGRAWVLAHEIGHTLGAEHSYDHRRLMKGRGVEGSEENWTEEDAVFNEDNHIETEPFVDYMVDTGVHKYNCPQESVPAKYRDFFES